MNALFTVITHIPTYVMYLGEAEFNSIDLRNAASGLD